MKQTEEEFINDFRLPLAMSREMFDATFIAVQCHCTFISCPGWYVKTKKQIRERLTIDWSNHINGIGLPDWSDEVLDNSIKIAQSNLISDVIEKMEE